MSTTISQVGTPQAPVETTAKKYEKPIENPPSFKGKTENDQFVKTYEVEATKGKKWGVGIASAFLPGLGQAINGQWGKAAGYFCGFNGCVVATSLAAAMLKGPKAKLATALVGGLASLGINIKSITDAVKNAKSYERIVDKEGLGKQGKYN